MLVKGEESLALGVLLDEGSDQERSGDPGLGVNIKFDIVDFFVHSLNKLQYPVDDSLLLKLLQVEVRHQEADIVAIDGVLPEDVQLIRSSREERRYLLAHKLIDHFHLLEHKGDLRCQSTQGTQSPKNPTTQGTQSPNSKTSKRNRKKSSS